MSVISYTRPPRVGYNRHIRSKIIIDFVWYTMYVDYGNSMERYTLADIVGKFDFIQDKMYTDRDGYDQYVMHVETGRVFGMNIDGDNTAHYISTQEWKPNITGSRMIDESAIRDFDGKTGQWDY